MWPEYKGNGVMASMGNIMENPYVGILMVDFFETAVGLHINGHARIVENQAVEAFGGIFDRLAFATPFAESPEMKKTPERWVVVAIEEAYVHCSKHIPMLRYLDGEESKEAEVGRRAGDVFKAKNGERAWLQPPVCAPEYDAGAGGRRSGAGDRHRALRATAAAAPHAAADQEIEALSRGAVRHVGPPRP